MVDDMTIRSDNAALLLLHDDEDPMKVVREA
jgi:hypothetical protein